jgi:uncharacterized protein (DUF58 family)
LNPTTRTILLLAGASIGPLGYALTGGSFVFAVIPPLLVITLAVVDRITGTKVNLSVRREVPRVLSVGATNPVTLVLEGGKRTPLSLEVVDEPFDDVRIQAVDNMNGVVLKPFETRRLVYSLVPLRRGSYRFFGVQVRYLSRMRLWWVKERFEVVDDVQVFPDISAVSRFELLARQNNLQEIGLRAVRKAGAGMEFERMREYRPGDEPRMVDWKTTARIGKLTVREMGEERNQNILIAIDTGTMMRQTTGGMSHFDYALNTTIFLSHIASKKGDNVGVILFNDKIVKYLPLNRGIGAVDNIVAHCYDANPEPVATDYDVLFQFIMQTVQKRSLLITMTHMGFEDEQRAIDKWSREMMRRHLPLFLFFKDPSFETSLAALPRNRTEAFQHAATANTLVERRQALNNLLNNGIMALETAPEEHSAVAINNYLQIKTRSLL